MEKLNKIFLSILPIFVCIQGVKISFNGLHWFEEGATGPFVWELVLLCFVATRFSIERQKFNNIISREAKISLITISLLIYLPVLLIPFFASVSIVELFVGGGVFRVFSLFLLFSLCLFIRPLTQSEFKLFTYSLLFAALINSFYSVAGYYGFVYADFWRAQSLNNVRASGLFYSPGILGVVIILSVGALYLAKIHFSIKAVIYLVLFFALWLTVSRTGFVGVFVLILSNFLFSIIRSRELRVVSFLFISLGSFLVAVVFFPYLRDLDYARFYGNLDALRVFIENPFGVPYGAWNEFGRFPSPHNSILFFFNYGGIFSGFAFCFSISLIVFKQFSIDFESMNWIVRERKTRLFSIIFAWIVASQFEQVVVAVSSLVLFIPFVVEFLRVQPYFIYERNKRRTFLQQSLVPRRS